MPSRTKKQAKQIVVRAIEPGTRHATKTVFGTLTQLNNHKPLHELEPVDWTLPVPKPWKQPKSRPASCRPQVPRRNPGRADGKTWMSAQFVCGSALGAVEDGGESDDAWQYDVDREWGREEWEWARLEEHWAREAADVEEDVWGYDRLQERREVSIMDIAKPMKLKGISREFEVVDTVRRVIALEEDQAPTWANRIGVDPELDGWEVLDSEESRRGLGSYAELVQLQPH